MSLSVKSAGVAQPAFMLENQIAFLDWQEIGFAEILLACSHLGGLKLLPCIPRTLPMLFLCPTLRFQEMKIGRGVGPFGKMTNDEKRVIYPTVVHVRAIKFVTSARVIGRVLEALL